MWLMHWLHAPETTEFVDTDALRLPFFKPVVLTENPSERIIRIVVPFLQHASLAVANQANAIRGRFYANNPNNLGRAIVLNTENVILVQAHDRSRTRMPRSPAHSVAGLIGLEKGRCFAGPRTVR